jgi:hypothetical protein
VSGTYDSLSGKFSADGRYDLQWGDGILSVLGGHDQFYRYTYGVVTEENSADAQYTFYPNRENKYLSLGFRASRDSTEVPGVKLYEYAGPGVFVNYDDVTQKPTEISPTKGVSALLDYQYFLGTIGNVDFPRTRVSLATYESRLLPKRHALALALDGYFSPKNRSVFLGSSAGGDYSLTFLSAKSLITRGYPVGEFIGWNLASGSAEYRFPLSDSHSEPGLFPLLFRRWHAAVFVDALTLDGYYYAKDVNGPRTAGMGNFFYGTGAEVRTDTTVAYHLPVMFRFGIFYGCNENAFGGWEPYISLSVPGF